MLIIRMASSYCSVLRKHKAILLLWIVCLILHDGTNGFVAVRNVNEKTVRFRLSCQQDDLAAETKADNLNLVSERTKGGPKWKQTPIQNSATMNYTSSSTTKDPCYLLVLEAVLGLQQMQDKKLVHLSIVGSRSKQLASHDSDYDVKATILHSVSDHLLQNVINSKSFETHIVHPETGEKVKVEGTLISYLMMQRYALSTSTEAYDAFYGIVLYETPESALLQDLFRKAYTPFRLAYAFAGILHHERKKIKKKNLDGHIKNVANMVYYASMAQGFRDQCSCAEQLEEPLPQDALVLLERGLLVNHVDPELEQNIRMLYQQRREDKSRTDVDTEPFADFIEAASTKLEIQNVNFRSADATNQLEQEAEAVFLRIMHSIMKIEQQELQHLDPSCG